MEETVMEAQGLAITENILEQDNESAIELEKSGRTSAGPKKGTPTSDISGCRTVQRRKESRSALDRPAHVCQFLYQTSPGEEFIQLFPSHHTESQTR